MEEGGATSFLDNVIDYERRYFCGMYFSSGVLPLQKGKERVQDFLFKNEGVFAIFGKNVEQSNFLKSVEDGLLPRIECSGGEISYWIYKNREGGFSDERIYETLVGARDSYLMDNNLHEFDFASRKMSRRVYEAVRDDLKNLSSGIDK